MCVMAVLLTATAGNGATRRIARMLRCFFLPAGFPSGFMTLRHGVRFGGILLAAGATMRTICV